MSVNIFKNGILSKIAGAVGDAVPLINNFLTNQEGKGAADANTVYVLNNKIEELNSSLSNNVRYPDYTNIVKSGVVTDWVATEDIYFESLYCEYYGSTISTDYRVKVNDAYVGAKNSASISSSKLYISTSHGYAKKGDVISCKTSTFVAYGLKK